MHARLLLCSALCALGISACTTADDGTPIPTEDPGVEGAAGALSEDSSLDGGTTCRGRHYWTCKDNRTPQHPRGDVELIDTLVPHHQMAVKMAELVLARGADPEVKAMAERVKSAQSKEIAELLAIRSELKGCTTVTPIPDPHMEKAMMTMMEMEGLALDLMFVTDMIPHHAGALQFTHYALPKLHHPELIALAHEVIDAQSKEIGELHAMKERLRAAMPNHDDGGTMPAGDTGTTHAM